MNKKSMKEYRIWRAMKARCYAPSCSNLYYQKDGIKVCDRWRNSFENFIADMGAIPGNDYSIERIDIYKDYCPENCKWILMSEQQKNRRNVPIYTYKGESHCLSEWAKILGFNLARARGRIRRGYSFEEALQDDLYNRQITINGETRQIYEWCTYYGINAGDVYSRIHRGWSKEDAILKDQQSILRRN